MVTREDIKDIVILSYLTDTMREKLLPHLEMLHFEQNDIVFRSGDQADHFYMLKRGKVLLEQRVSDTMTIFMGAIRPGFSFGWSAALDGQAYTLDTVCAEPCDVVAVKGSALSDLMEANPDMGFRMTQRLLRVVKKRLDQRTVQFLTVITQHPDILPLLEKQGN